MLSHLDLVANIRFPGARAHGIQVAAMAEALAATGLTVDVVVPRRFPYRSIDPFTHYGVRPTFRVQRIASLDTIDMVPPRWQRVPFLVQSATFAWRSLARAALRREAGVLLRDHYTLDVLCTGLRAADLRRVSAEVHDLPRSDARRARLADRLRRIPAIVAITSGLRDDLVELGVDPEAILVAADGVWLHRFEGLHEPAVARAELSMREMPTVVYAGQLYEWKGVDVLIEAMARLPDVQLMVVGGDAQNLARIVGLADTHAPGRTVLTGQLPHPAVPFHLSAGDVVVLPNTARAAISERYTSPLKLFEAMASGRPIVASDLPSLREVLEHDVNAHLVAPDDPDALAAGLAAVLGDPEYRARLAARAREDVRRFDWSERGRRVAAFLQQRLGVEAA